MSSDQPVESAEQDQLTCVVLNPSTLAKARTGGVMTRLLTRTALDLCGAVMFEPGYDLTQDLAEIFSRDSLAGDDDPRTVMLVQRYIEEHFVPTSAGQRQSMMLLLFRGPQAFELIKEAVGDYESPSIRCTYGDFVRDANGKVIYFEPAVFCPQGEKTACRVLHLFSSWADSEGGFLKRVVPKGQAAKANYQRSLVMIKPDNFDYPCGRPGSIINIFSRTDLRIMATKIAHLSVAQALEFYEPVRDIMIEKLGEEAGGKRFVELIRFMTGRTPEECADEADREAPGTAKVMILVYEGLDAIAKIRKVLGPTDPAKAAPGTVRREFGTSMMINGAHASDSPESAEREMRILRVGENVLTPLVHKYYPDASSTGRLRLPNQQD